MKRFLTLILALVSLSATAGIVQVKPGRPYLENFESSATDWTLVDADGDGYNWEITRMPGVQFHSGNTCLASASWTANGGPNGRDLQPDNWAITPPIVISECETAVLTWWVTEQDPKFLGDRLEVLVSTTTPDIESFKSLSKETLNNGQYEQRSADLTPYIGQQIYIAFRHFNRDSFYRIDLDDVAIYCNNEAGVKTPTVNVRKDAYDLQGRPAGKATRGDVLIENGKKILK